MKRYAKFGYAAPLRSRVIVENHKGGGGEMTPTRAKVNAAAATDRRQSQPGVNSERRSGSNRALTTGKLSDPALSRLRYWGGPASDAAATVFGSSPRDNSGRSCLRLVEAKSLRLFARINRKLLIDNCW